MPKPSLLQYRAAMVASRHAVVSSTRTERQSDFISFSNLPYLTMAIPSRNLSVRSVFRSVSRLVRGACAWDSASAGVERRPDGGSGGCGRPQG